MGDADSKTESDKFLRKESIDLLKEKAIRRGRLTEEETRLMIQY